MIVYYNKKEYKNLKECLRSRESCYKKNDNGAKDDDGVTRKVFLPR